MKKNDQAFFFFNWSHFLIFFFSFLFLFNIFFLIHLLFQVKFTGCIVEKKNLTWVLRQKQAIFFFGQRLGQGWNTKFGTNASNKMLLSAAECQGYSSAISKLWENHVMKKPTKGRGER